MRWLRLAGCFVAVAALASGSLASAQGSGSKWEIEAHVGLAATSNPAGGADTLPTTGTIVGGRISASTLFAGDGARLFSENQRATLGASASTIVPLDSVLLSSAIRRQPGAAIGMRVRRTLRPRLALEASAEGDIAHLAFGSASLDAIEATRASFGPALEPALSVSRLASGASADVTLRDHATAYQAFTTGALVISFRDVGRFQPYVEAGGGAVFRGGHSPVATLVGTYQLGDPAQLLGTDHVTLSYVEHTITPVVLVGGGATYQVTPRWGLRIDAREHLYANTTANHLDALPTSAFQSTGQPLPVVNVGALQFSATSPLNGSAVNAATTFAGSGMKAHLSVSAGLVLHF